MPVKKFTISYWHKHIPICTLHINVNAIQTSWALNSCLSVCKTLCKKTKFNDSPCLPGWLRGKIVLLNSRGMRPSRKKNAYWVLCMCVGTRAYVRARSPMRFSPYFYMVYRTHLTLSIERIHGGFPAAGITGVDDVIVDQGGRVDHLRDLGYLKLWLE